MTAPFAKDRNFRAYASALVRHHNALAQGLDDSRVEEIEDLMSSLWPKLSEEHQRELRGASSDLNWLRRGFTPAPKGRRKEDVTASDLDNFQALNEAALSDKEAALPLLHSVRACAPALEAGLVALCRAKCYLDLGLPEVSEPFLKATVDLAGHRSEPCRAAFVMLVHVSPSGAFQKATEVMSQTTKYPPVVVAYAVRYFVDFLGESAKISREKLADEMSKARFRLDEEPTPREDRVTFYRLAGTLLMGAGMPDASVSYFEQGLALEPEDSEFLGWLGDAVYPRDRERAVELFKMSILRQTRLVRPWLLIAHHFLAEGDFERAHAYAGQAYERSGDAVISAFALEIMGISLTEMGGPFDIAHAMLQRAAKLAPEQEWIVRNLMAFEKRTQPTLSDRGWYFEEHNLIPETQGRWRADLFRLIPN